MGNSAFNKEEIDYLYSLPSVVRVTKSRITYSEMFKRECVKRYMSGESPARVFREAGLDPALIGYKRVERCLARWKLRYAASLTDEETAPAETPAPAGAAMAGTKNFVGNEAIAQLFRRKTTRWDLRDILISQQIRRIAELEERVLALQYRETQMAQVLEQNHIADPTAVPEPAPPKEVKGGQKENFRWKRVLVPTPILGTA